MTKIPPLWMAHHVMVVSWSPQEAWGVKKRFNFRPCFFFFPSDMHLQKLGNVILDLY